MSHLTISIGSKQKSRTGPSLFSPTKFTDNDHSTYKRKLTRKHAYWLRRGPSASEQIDARSPDLAQQPSPTVQDQTQSFFRRFKASTPTSPKTPLSPPASAPLYRTTGPVPKYVTHSARSARQDQMQRQLHQAINMVATARCSHHSRYAVRLGSTDEISRRPVVVSPPPILSPDTNWFQGTHVKLAGAGTPPASSPKFSSPLPTTAEERREAASKWKPRHLDPAAMIKPFPEDSRAELNTSPPLEKARVRSVRLSSVVVIQAPPSKPATPVSPPSSTDGTGDPDKHDVDQPWTSETPSQPKPEQSGENDTAPLSPPIVLPDFPIPPPMTAAWRAESIRQRKLAKERARRANMSSLTINSQHENSLLARRLGHRIANGATVGSQTLQLVTPSLPPSPLSNVHFTVTSPVGEEISIGNATTTINSAKSYTSQVTGREGSATHTVVEPATLGIESPKTIVSCH